MDDAELRRRATELGVQVTYDDVDQVTHRADPEVLAAVLDVLDADRAAATRASVPPVHLDPRVAVAIDGRLNDASLLVDGSSQPVEVRTDRRGNSTISLPDGLPVGCHVLEVSTADEVAECLIVVAPDAMPGLDRGPHRRNGWTSLFVPAYALWERDAPLPSYRHLHDAAERIAAHGIDMLATLPLYATFLDEPFDPSPYSPISRLHWSEAYIDDDALPDAPFPTSLIGGDMVEWRALAARRRHQLLDAARNADDALLDRLAQFVAADPDVGAYARFMTDRRADGHHTNADTEAGADAEIVGRSHELAQLLCDEQLASFGAASASEPTSPSRRHASLSLDLPVGSHPDGYETWAYPNLFAPMAVGAPPDTFFTEGQNWGFPPQLPGEMRDSGYQLWRQMIERAGRHVDMLRIDHVMAVHRLWWVPDGFPADRGVYVRYPQDELLAVIAASAAAADVAVVGENLGTVPPAVGAALEKWGMLGMYEEQFNMGGPELADIPRGSVAGIRTHDMAAFADHVATADLTSYRAALKADHHTVDHSANQSGNQSGDGDELLDAVLLRLIESRATMVVADLDDLLGETRPHNLPGRIVPGIWQRRLDEPISDTFEREDVSRRLATLGAR